MELNPTLTFLELVDGAWTPITGLTVNDIRLVDVSGGTYDGVTIYPDNVTTPQFSELGNGQYAIGYFQHANFTSTIGSGYKYYVKVQRKISGTWTNQYQFGIFWIGDENENFMNVEGNQTLAGVKTFSSFPVTPSSAPTTDYQVANKKYVNDQDLTKVSKDGTIAMTGALNMDSHKINNLTAGTASSDAVNLSQLQSYTAPAQYHAIMAEAAGVVTPTVWKNTTGATITVSKVTTGIFQIVASTGVFQMSADPISYTSCIIQERTDGSSPTIHHGYSVSHSDSRTLLVYVFDEDDTAVDFFDVEVMISCYTAP